MSQACWNPSTAVNRHNERPTRHVTRDRRKKAPCHTEEAGIELEKIKNSKIQNKKKNRAQ
jgi:hypothetical protein